MSEEETRAYYDDPENAQAMCDMLMKAHPGWRVRRLSPDRTFLSVPVWVARREDWPAHQPSRSNENAGMLNLTMTLIDKGAVVS
jgi:hypothetical protein